MIELKQSKNYYNYDVFDIVTNEGILEISYQNNLDLYWAYKYKDTIDKEDKIKEIIIDKENYYIYLLFDELYDSIKTHDPWKYFPSKDIFSHNKNTIDYNNLYHDDMITWYSDDFANTNLASNFSIKKEEDKYIVTIVRSEEEPTNGNYFKTFSVRIRTSGSRYGEYYIAFMTMYQKLKQYNYNNHQIHIEEYLYNQKRRVLKNTDR